MKMDYDNLSVSRSKPVWNILFYFITDELKDFYVNLTRVFEQSYKINARPAMAVAHSLGNMVRQPHYQISC